MVLRFHAATLSDVSHLFALEQRIDQARSQVRPYDRPARTHPATPHHPEIARFYCSGEDDDILVATSTSNKTALSRMLPAITSSASDAAGCWSASESRRLLTALSFWASSRILMADMGYPISRVPKEKKTSGGLT